MRVEECSLDTYLEHPTGDQANWEQMGESIYPKKEDATIRKQQLGINKFVRKLLNSLRTTFFNVQLQGFENHQKVERMWRNHCT